MHASVTNIMNKLLTVRVPILYHNLVAMARLTCIALICLSPLVSDLRFICGLRQECILLRLIHVARLTCIALFCLSPIVSDLRFICGLCDLREKGVLILLNLQACLCKSDELAQSVSVVLLLLYLQARLR
jgi:hypothetical protein